MKAKKMPIALMGLLSIALVVLKTPSRADGPRLGAEVYSIVVVSQVMPDSAAARAGLQKGDIIFGINGHPTPDAATFARLVKSAPDGAVHIKVLRNDHTLTLTADLGKTTAHATKSPNKAAPATPQSAQAASHKRSGPPYPPAGKYDCWNEFYTPMYSGSFVLSNGNTYQYLTGSKSKGKYQYDAKTKKIKWLSGILARESTGAEYKSSTNDGPVIIVHFPDVMGQKSSQTCFWRGAAK